MKKKLYEKPKTVVFLLSQQPELLAGSALTATISALEEEEWIPDPSAPEMDLPESLDVSLDL